MLLCTHPRDGWTVFITEANYYSFRHCYLNGRYPCRQYNGGSVNIAVTCGIHMTSFLSNIHINIAITAINAFFVHTGILEY